MQALLGPGWCRVLLVRTEPAQEEAVTKMRIRNARWVTHRVKLPAFNRPGVNRLSAAVMAALLFVPMASAAAPALVTPQAGGRPLVIGREVDSPPFALGKPDG